MDQVKIGAFIAECRKAKGLTQIELAEQLAISNRTVSKWETGRGLPDVSLMVPLCTLLSISVNELLTGERLSQENYNEKAEEHIMELMKTTEKQTQNKRSSWTAGLIGLLLFGAFYRSVYGAFMTAVPWFIDLPSLFGVLGISALILGLGGEWSCLTDAFCLCIRRGKNKDGVRAEADRIKRAELAVAAAIRVSLLSGGFVCCFSVPALLRYGEPSTFGPYLAVMVLSLLYACLIALLLYPVSLRLRRYSHIEA